MMKRLFFAFVLVGGAVTMANAQIDDIKMLMGLQKFKDAREKLDKAMANAKFAAKAESYIAKAAIYGQLSADPAFKDQSAQLLKDGEEAYKKYLSMDAKQALIKDPYYANAPINFYSGAYTLGVAAYNAKNWDEATAGLQRTSEWSDFLIKNQLASSLTFDTTVNLLAGVSYQNAKKNDQAAFFYKRLIDHNVAGADNEFFYQAMARFAFDKNQSDSFNYYMSVGKKQYPKSEYFNLSEQDFILDIKDEAERFKRIEANLAAHPEDAKMQETYGLLLYDKLNGENAKAAITLPDYAEKQAKMVAYLSKGAENSPATAGKDYYFLGSHFINKAVAINDSIKAVVAQMKAQSNLAKPDPKTGKLPAAGKELVAKREALYKNYDAEIESGLVYLHKMADVYGKASNLSNMDKQYYKRAVDQMILIYGDKKNTAKQPAEKAKFAAEEKKWNDVYSSIRN